MGRLRLPLVALAAASLAAPAALPAGLGEGPEPVVIEITGARYSFSSYAKTVRGVRRSQLGVSTLQSSSSLDPGGKTTIRVRGSLKRPSGAAKTFTAYGTFWRIDYLEPVVALEIKVRVTATSDPEACPVGAKGTITVVDDDTPLPGGGSMDSVRLRFSGPACRAFSRSWSNTDSPTTDPPTGGPSGGQRAAVEIDLETTGPPNGSPSPEAGRPPAP